MTGGPPPPPELACRQILGFVATTIARRPAVRTAQRRLEELADPSVRITLSARDAAWRSPHREPLAGERMVRGGHQLSRSDELGGGDALFGTMKNELVHRRSWRSRIELRTAHIEYSEVFYNRRRLHPSLDYRPPAGSKGNATR